MGQTRLMTVIIGVLIGVMGTYGHIIDKISVAIWLLLLIVSLLVIVYSHILDRLDKIESRIDGVSKWKK